MKKILIYSIFVLSFMSFLFSGCDGGESGTSGNSGPDPGTITCPSSTGVDPESQWHLGVVPGLKATTAWGGGTITGTGVTVAVVDDGLDYAHEDLCANGNFALNWNYVDSNNRPAAGRHGTAVAGIIASVNNNALGGRGIAYDATLVGYNLLEYQTVSNEANAMTRNDQVVAVSNNSWGPADCRGQIADSTSSWNLAVEEGVTTGRDGKGIVYLWAAGNGAGPFNDTIFGGETELIPLNWKNPEFEVDNSNYDGYANSPYVMAIGAHSIIDQRSYYSEKGANLLVVAPSSGYTTRITTTDITGSDGYNSTNYTDSFGGTSAATPMVAGVVALMLDANEYLTWRDVRWILATTARQIDDTDSDWTTNGAGRWVNHRYGFGAVDAAAAVSAASSYSSYITGAYEQGSVTDSDGFTATALSSVSDTVTVSLNKTVEFVTVTVDMKHPDAGELKISLTSPDQNGSSQDSTSVLTEQHDCYSDCSFPSAGSCTWFSGTFGNSFTFGTVRHLGENSDGTWTLTIENSGSTAAVIDNWKLTIYGH